MERIVATCGKCKANGPDIGVDHVRACYGLAESTSRPETVSFNPETGETSPPGYEEWPDDETAQGDEEKRLASQAEELIRHDLAVRYAERGEAKRIGARWDPKDRVWYVMESPSWEAPEKWRKGAPIHDLDVGIYEFKESISGTDLTSVEYYMVYVSQYGRNQGKTVAKKLVFPEGGEVNRDINGPAVGEWVSCGTAPLRFLKPEMALSKEEAAQFGQIYGWCGLCGRVLQNEDSKRAGIGPVCANK